MTTHVLRRIARRFGLVLCASIAVSAIIYALALIALDDLEDRSQPSASAVLRGGLVLTARGSTVEVWQSSTQLAAVTAHNASLVSANFVANGAAILTTDGSGVVRLTWLGPAQRLDAATLPAFSQSLREALWNSYGAPISRAALFLTAQVMPLQIPNTRRGRRGRVFRDCPGCPEMVEIEPGLVLRGGRLLVDRSDGWRRLSAIPARFDVGKFPVTFEEWDTCVVSGGCGGYRPDDQGWGRGRRPVINVSWADAKEYIAWLSSKTGKKYRLLTETEREYVTRAGTTSRFWWGEHIGEGLANCDGCGSPWDKSQTAPVGSFNANRFGLFDVHGNVWEWIEDCGSEAAQADNSGTRCSLRGGAWTSNPDQLRAAVGIRSAPTDRKADFGFRVARDLTP
jgi:formylglycine-generating enzyme required for sulfatase activity